MINKIKLFFRSLKENPQYRKSFLQKIAIVFSAAATLALFLVVMLFVSVRAGWFGKLPSHRELASVENYLSSEILAEDGRLLGKYFIYDRSHATPDQISENVYHSLIATEDARFYNHNGIDYRSLGRVFFKSLLLQQRSAGGGSTISQQLAKNLFARTNNGFLSMPVNKIREMIIARRLEKIYSKNEILVLYLNTVPFGDNVFGISAASLRFFNKNPRDLNMEEAAVLIGMLKATSAFNPRLYPERALHRRNTVIGQLQRYDYIDINTADSLRALPIVMDYNPITHNQGPAPYFRETVRQEVLQILKEYNVHNQTDYNLYTDGLRIYTTLNYDLQLLAEAAVKSQLTRQQKIMDAFYRNQTPQRASSLVNSLMRNTNRYKSLRKRKAEAAEIEAEFSSPVAMELFGWDGPTPVTISPRDSIFRMQQILHGALVSIDPGNGHVKAWVGGNDFRHFQHENVMSLRQAGSTFKPFVYATALQQGIDPCEYVKNEQTVYEDYDNWSPVNSRGEYEGYYNMTGALAQSINTVSAHYISLTGIMPVIETARNCGIKSDMPRVPSLALGTANVSLMELTASYAAFLREGVPVNPIWLLKVEDKNGRVLYENRKQQPYDPVIAAEAALMTRHMLQAAVDSGTAGSLRYNSGLQGALAGKTGTTQNNADTWFVGFSPNLITGVWTGVENPAFANIYKAPLGSGASAVPLWGDYHRRIQHHPDVRKFTRGNFTALPDSLALKLGCAMYLEELPGQNWWESVFGPADREQRPRRREREEDRPRSRLRRWLEEIF